MSWLARLKNRNGHRTHATEPTKPGFVGFVAPDLARIKKTGGDAPAANDQTQQTELDPDRCCWSHCSAMNTAKIDLFNQRLDRFANKGMTMANAEKLTDLLVIRDREQDPCAACLECNYLNGRQCRQWRQAGVSSQTLPFELLTSLQNCPTFAPIQRNSND